MPYLLEKCSCVMERGGTIEMVKGLMDGGRMFWREISETTGSGRASGEGLAGIGCACRSGAPELPRCSCLAVM